MLVALALWVVATLGFFFYVANFGSYNKTYGTLGGLIVLPALALDHERRAAVRRGVRRRARAHPRGSSAGVPPEESLDLPLREEPKPKKTAEDLAREEARTAP